MTVLLQINNDPYVVEYMHNKGLKTGCIENVFCGPEDHTDEDEQHKPKEPAGAKLS